MASRRPINPEWSQRRRQIQRQVNAANNPRNQNETGGYGQDRPGAQDTWYGQGGTIDYGRFARMPHNMSGNLATTPEEIRQAMAFNKQRNAAANAQVQSVFGPTVGNGGVQDPNSPRHPGGSKGQPYYPSTTPFPWESWADQHGVSSPRTRPGTKPPIGVWPLPIITDQGGGPYPYPPPSPVVAEPGPGTLPGSTPPGPGSKRQPTTPGWRGANKNRPGGLGGAKGQGYRAGSRLRPTRRPRGPR